MKNKCIVAHAGKRDSYQVALAMYESGYLDKLVTDFYVPDIIYRISQKRFGKRHCEGLPSSIVTNCMPAFAQDIKAYLKRVSVDHPVKDELVSKRAYDIGRKNSSNLFLYSYYAFHAFNSAINEGLPVKRLLFQLHPHTISVRDILKDEIEKFPYAKASILAENEFSFSDDHLTKLIMEPVLAEHIIVASTYTKNTLVENNISPDKIKVASYGVNLKGFFKRNSPPNNSGLRIIFVGSMVQRKGLTYLLEAIRSLKSPSIELILCGRGLIDVHLLEYYRKDVKFTVKIDITHEELINELHLSDVFVLPSLSEGFAQVILEAMAVGLPVIATPNSCAPDIIEDGKDGFIIPVKDIDALAGKIEWCLINKNELFSMGQLAARKTELYTWDKFRREVVNFYRESIQ